MKLGAGDRQMLHDLDGAGTAAIATAVRWCAIPSGSRNLAGLHAMANALVPALAELPGPIERIALPDTEEVTADGEIRPLPNGEALRLRVRPEAPVQVALTGHYDTVYPADTSFRDVVDVPGGRLNGPGIADMKGGIAVLLAALAGWERHPDAARLGYTLLLSPDEETGSLASAPLLAELAAGATVGLTYEPASSDGRMVSARKGSGNFQLVVRGRAAHAGRDFATGRNALAAAARAATALHDLNGRREGVTVNVARIDGGGALNTVPDRAVLRFNARLPDAAAQDWLEAALAEVVAETGGDGLSASLHGGITRPPKPFGPAQAALFEGAAATAALIGLPLPHGPSGGVCEGNNLHAAGLPGLDTLGVRGGDIHSGREYAETDSFAERIALSALLLAKLADGSIDGADLKQQLASERTAAS
jgi:glutamate carboxypeptidase